MSTHKQETPPVTKKNTAIKLSERQQPQVRVIFLTKELNKKIEEKAIDMFGSRKGNVSLYMEQAMRVHLHMTVEGVKEI
jgi:hypothetical protein